MTTTAAPLRIVIADDHALFRQGLRSMLTLHPEVTVVAEIERARELVATIERTPCDILLLDLHMERSSVIDIKQLAQRTTVIVVTANEEPDAVLNALRAGARGIVFKRFAIETLMEAVRAAAGGAMWMPPAVQAEMTARWKDPTGDGLTPRESEIVQHVARGLRNAEIGKRLFISEATVKAHLVSVFQKLGIRDRVELTRYAFRLGLVGLDDQES